MDADKNRRQTNSRVTPTRLGIPLPTGAACDRCSSVRQTCASLHGRGVAVPVSRLAFGTAIARKRKEKWPPGEDDNVSLSS